MLLAFSGQLVEQAKVSLAVNPILTVTGGGETRVLLGFSGQLVEQSKVILAVNLIHSYCHGRW